MKLSSRKKLISEAEDILREMKVTKSSYVFTRSEGNSINSALSEVQTHLENLKTDIDDAISAMQELEEEMDNGENTFGAGGYEIPKDVVSDLFGSAFRLAKPKPGEPLSNVIKQMNKILNLFGKR